MKRAFTQPDLRELLLTSSSSESEFSGGSSDSYEPPMDESNSNISHMSSGASESSLESVEDLHGMQDGESAPNSSISVADPSLILWSDKCENFIPRKNISARRVNSISKDISYCSTHLQIFQKLFPRSLCLYIAQCTNERIEQFNNSKRSRANIKKIDIGEVQIMLGCIFIMSYNRVPSISDYWSEHNSLENQAIKNAISRDRYKIIASKIYFAPPQKPTDCSKTYYVDDVVQCLKGTFAKHRQDSCFQSIDESMTKFKGRSTLKQFMPLKPTKRGIKMWLRCDSLSGYTYDFNIYSGREQYQIDGTTLGERVVNTLASTIKEKDVTLCFDRFFTSVNLLANLEYAAVGTYMPNRKNTLKIDDKLETGEASFRTGSTGLLCAKWKDSKDVFIMSNCHTPSVTVIQKTQKDGKKVAIPCPEMIKDYREIMGGVDLADQMAGLYDHDRKSAKWWKKVFYRLLLMTAVNSWVIYNDINRRKTPFIDFLVSLAEDLITEGKKTAAVQRSRRRGRLSQKRKRFGNVSLHLPIEGRTRRRCSNCSTNKKQTRTRTICQECDIPLCKHCFAIFHTI